MNDFSPNLFADTRKAPAMRSMVKQCRGCGKTFTVKWTWGAPSNYHSDPCKRKHWLKLTMDWKRANPKRMKELRSKYYKKQREKETVFTPKYDFENEFQ